MKHTVEEVRERVARAICAGCGENPDHLGDARGNDYRWQDYLDAADAAIDAHITQPAQSADVIPEGCIAVPRSLVERWANVDAFNAPVGAAMELRVIAGEMLMHAAALQEKGNG